MADIRFTCRDCTEPIFCCATIAKGLGECSDFDRVSQRRTGAVSFDVRNGFWRNIRSRLGHSNHFSLRVDARRRVANLFISIVVDRRSFDDCQNVVTILNSVSQTLQQDNCTTMPKDSTFGLCIKCPASTIDGRQTFFFI